MRYFFSLPVCCLLVLLTCSQSLAHSLQFFAYAAGERVYTEASSYPDGQPVVGGQIEVYDSNGTLLLEGVTDQKGFFSFILETKEDLTLSLATSMGHKKMFYLTSENM